MSATSDAINLGNLYTTRWQFMVLILAAANGQRGIGKSLVAENIKTRGWFNFRPEDNLPYPSGSGPRWVDQLELARADCKQKWRFMPDDRNDWRPTQEGECYLANVKAAVRDGALDMKKCCLWTPIFKRYINPTYESGSDETYRPLKIYEDAPDLKQNVKRIIRRIKDERKQASN